jgi:DNA-directed RNA polymerase-3 subunit RPC5
LLICLDQLHLTRLDGLVQLRTQFHHIDASAQLEAVNRRREKEAQEGTKPAEPKAFLPTVKKSGGDTAAEMTQAFMKSANVETWDKLRYFDENVCYQPSSTATKTNYTGRRTRHTTATATV